MSNPKHIQLILNGTIQSLKSIVPLPLEVQKPAVVPHAFQQTEMGVLIGMIGDLRGRIILDSTSSAFSAIGNSMFGMAVEGEMLESFAGELGNMIAGHICTHAAAGGLHLDITTPTVMLGSGKLSGFSSAVSLPVCMPEAGLVTIVLAIDD